MGRYVISYCRHDSSAFPLLLHEALTEDSDVEPWLDVKNDPQRKASLPDVIKQSQGLLVVLPTAAMDARFRREIELAVEYHRPRIQLRASARAARLWPEGSWRVVDFLEEFRSSFNELLRLIDHYQFNFDASDGLVIDEELTRTEQDFGTASTSTERTRMGQHMTGLRQRQAAPSRDDGPEQPRPQRPVQDPSAVPATTGRRIRFINDLPDVPPDPSQFQDRDAQTELLDEYVRTPQTRAIVVSGPAGFGKTAMVARYLRRLESDSGTAPLDAVLYLSAHGTEPLSPAVLLEGLRQVAAREATDHEALLLRSDLRALQKLEGLLPHLTGVRACIVIDSLEELLDPTTKLADRQLDDLVARLLSIDNDGITLILISRRWPAQVLVGLQGDGEVQPLRLDHGLPRRHVRRLFEGLDADATLGLAGMEEDGFGQLYERTGGHPRALEALYAILRDNPRTTPSELLDQMAGLRRDAVVDFLVGEMFDHLLPPDQRVLQALAVFGRPVPPDVVEALLRAHTSLKQLESLERLVWLRIVRREGTAYYLPSPDRDVAFARIPEGLPSDRDREPPPYTRFALLRRAADQLAQSQVPEPRRVAELSPTLTEIELRIRGHEFVKAYERIKEIQGRLSGWGHLDLVAAPRSQLVGKLGDPRREFANFAALGDIDMDREEPADAADHYRRAITIAKRLDRPRAVAALRVNLASALGDSGQLIEAEDAYHDALSVADEHLSPREQAYALSGLALCDAEAGRFTQALGHAERSLEIARSNGLSELEAAVLMNTGRWYGQLGEVLTAMERLEAARTLTERNGLGRLRGKCLDATAEVLVDQGRLSGAVQAAESAIAIGEEMHNSKLVREAASTLSLAELCAGCPDGLERARVRLDRVCRHRRHGHTLNALLLQGILALRRGDTETAWKAFEDARGEAESLGNVDDRRFDARDVEGVARCGLALCGQDDPSALEAASHAFSAARAASTASGVIVRVVRLLDELEAAGSPGILAGPRKAASDRSLPQVAAD